jgi:16S rRNA (cytidine1402-2'-O)-methyltransferase
LKDALEVYGDREAALASELTKMFESVKRGTISSLLESVSEAKLRGEYIVVIAGRDVKPLDAFAHLEEDSA